MLKPVFAIISGIFFFGASPAQTKPDTIVYYLKNSGKVVYSKDSADFFLVILPPDTNVDKNLFIVNEFYANGKPRLIGGSLTNNLDLKFQGPQIVYFPNGHKMRIGNYEDGELAGDMTEYYPNGKLYNTKTFTHDRSVLLNECRDSTGNVMARNGRGKWIKFFNDDFNYACSEGKVNNGREEGEWTGKRKDSVVFVFKYKEGRIESSKILNDQVYNQIFRTYQNPEFPGGFDAFSKFIRKNMRYPDSARTKGTYGIVVVGFIVEKDGSLTDIKVNKGLGNGCDEEAVRVIKMSPLWRPAIQNGKPVRVAYSVPVAFSLIVKKMSVRVSHY